MSRRLALVTGAAGFLGRHFVTELLNRDYDVIGVDLMPAMVSYGTDGPSQRHFITDVRSFIRSYVGSTADPDRFDLVVHCAARHPHRAAIDREPLNLAYNVELDARVIRWAAETRQCHLLYVSSSAVYPVELQTDPFVDSQLHEEDQLIGDECVRVPDGRYGWTKYLGELAVAAARETGLEATVVRPFSGYGPDQSTDFPFGAFRSRATLRMDPFDVWGTAIQTRDWIHVSDVVNGALAVTEARCSSPVNLCTGVSTSLGDLALMMSRAVGYEPELREVRDAPMGVMHRIGDPTLMNRFYTPQVTLEDGVAEAVRHAAEADEP